MEFNAGVSQRRDAPFPPMPEGASSDSSPGPDAQTGHRLSDETLAQLAKEWLTFERLRQILLTAGADDPILIPGCNSDVALVVCALFEPGRTEPQRELARVSLYRALADFPEFAKQYHGVEMVPANADEASRPQASPPVRRSRTAHEVMLAANADVFARWHEFQLGMERNGAVVCKVSIGSRKSSGTGFLVGERLVLTCFHVVESLLDDRGQPLVGSHKELKFLFDDIMPDGDVAGRYRKYVNPARHWLKAYSPPDPRENDAQDPLDALDPSCLDFALIELNEPVGRTAPAYRNGIPRNWIDLRDLAVAPTENSQLLIAQHPEGEDLRLTVGLFRDHSACQGRIRYWSPTHGGSSGAPCFNVQWKLYALHNAGYVRQQLSKSGNDIRVNQGVPINKIVDAIRSQGDPLSAVLRPSLMAAVTPDGVPILGRLDIAARIDEMLDPQSPLTTMIVRAPKGGGKTWTGRLIRSLVIDRGYEAFYFDAERFIADTPERFARRLIDEVVVNPQDDSPPPPDARQRARWITMRLAEWTRRTVAQTKGEPSAARPLWIILDRLDEVRFTQETHDLLVALIANEADKPSSVRFVLLGYSGDLASVPQGRIWRTDLDLFSAKAIRPFIEYMYEKHGFENDAEQTKIESRTLIQSLRANGLDTLSHLVRVLINYEQNFLENRQREMESGEFE